MFVDLIAARTLALVVVPFLQARSIAFATTCVAAYVGAPKYSPSPPWLFLKPVMILDFGLSGKFVSYTCEPTAANDESKRPSAPISLIVPLPAAFIWLPKAMPFGVNCQGMYTSCVSREIFAISDEKSDCCWLTPSRLTVTPAAFRTCSTGSARPVL